jgi:hypothetical protein
MKENTSNPDLVAACGLYCGSCRKYLNEKCPGCAKNDKASWCKVRSCCQSRAIQTCAACSTFVNPKECKKFNNPVSRIFEFVFRSDRAACIQEIRKTGVDGFAIYMSQNKLQTIKNIG